MALIFFVQIGGWVAVGDYEQSSKNEPFRVAILQENFGPEVIWSPATGDSLVEIFFSMNREAVRQNADLILWSEAVLPWPLEEGDEFIEGKPKNYPSYSGGTRVRS